MDEAVVQCHIAQALNSNKNRVNVWVAIFPVALLGIMDVTGKVGGVSDYATQYLASELISPGRSLE